VSYDTTIQSPAIGNAMRQALSLDAAGGLPLEASSTVVPVCIVGDVRSQIGSGIQSYGGFMSLVAVGGQYAKLGLECQPSLVVASGIKKIVPKRFFLNVGTAGYVLVNFGYNSLPNNVIAAAKRWDTKVNASGVGRMTGNNDVSVPNIAFRIWRLWLEANRTYELNVKDSNMVIVADPVGTPSISFETEAPNIALSVSAEWDEYYQ